MAKKILLLLGIITVLYVFWLIGLDMLYAYVLAFFSDIFSAILQLEADSSIVTSGGHIELAMTVTGKGTAHLPLDPLIMPTVILLSWQIFLFFQLDKKKALYGLLKNFGIFFLLQIIYVLLIVDWGQTVWINSIKETFLHAFGIVVLFIIIKDCIVNRIFIKQKKEAFAKK